MMTLQFYTRPACTLCHSALAAVQRVQQRTGFDLQVINIDTDPALRAQYDTVIPVVTFGKMELARSFIDEKKLAAAVQKVAINRPR